MTDKSSDQVIMEQVREKFSASDVASLANLRNNLVPSRVIKGEEELSYEQVNALSGALSLWEVVEGTQDAAKWFDGTLDRLGGLTPVEAIAQGLYRDLWAAVEAAPTVRSDRRDQ